MLYQYKRTYTDAVMEVLQGLIDNTPVTNKISSPVFHINGEWYLDLYPSGYRSSEAGSAPPPLLPL